MMTKTHDSKPTASLVLDSRTILRDGSHPLKLKIGWGKDDNRKWSIGYTFTKEKYAELLTNATRAPYKDIWVHLNAKLRKADNIIRDLMPFFRFEDFKERFFDAPNFKIQVDESSLMFICETVANNYKRKGQYSMSVKMRDSSRSLLKFVKMENMPMRAITPSFCREYEEYMYNKSKKFTRNGAGINLRHIRILFNEAISEGYIPREWYPFKRMSGERSFFKDAYVIPLERKSKEYLDEADLVKFSETKRFDTPAQRKAHCAWLVSFYCNGANAADFLNFRFRDIEGDFISFYREKIKYSTRQDRKLIRVFITPELRQLILEFGNPPAPNNYIFQCYTDEMDDEKRFLARKKFTTDVTRSMKILGEKLGLKAKVKLGNARHALANILKRNGVSREVVKDLFGHMSIVTADNYYESFGDDKFKEIATNYMSLDAIKSRIRDR
ncbi:tyrosine-type recombinase/integrase [Chryseolinea soli]|uniref:Tyr recombinase domain-containing protein n=1 Tax=Chryseolinea soli TaxID=2321403 RepID=A0A385SNU5_9BACT|nr:site-specific integrase [Chryseolinea soli]AYB31927.1 hypothetical protein D4L85_15745 [Chryseolinea soli]